MVSEQHGSDARPDLVRLALPAEARAIAGVQRRAWDADSEPVGRALLGSVDLDTMAEVWHAAISRPPEARCRVLVAVADHQVVGLATTLPSPDPDSDISADGAIEEFVVDPTARRRGHGSRLIHACVDTLRADGFVRARHWLRAEDDPRRVFLSEAGWAPDGAHREIGSDEDGIRIKQVRLHTTID
ncbi:MAG: GNAT family N-acetyltransferase [Microlunatus sp.]|nr:GNAT family N-acetyltransferase [Microlunatus sp.]MDN5770738.1 GNAT family N-acetyltransferase [Microlunatus sp.]MDN5803006.1 GNAT family N-acetyltransferase [Microlunatus sp.]